MRGWPAWKVLLELGRTAGGAFDLLRSSASQLGTVVRDHFRDKALGIQTRVPTLPSPEKGRHGDAGCYDPVGYATLDRLFDRLALGTEDVFIDFGSGQGRAVFTAASRGLRRVIGVELDEALVRVAEENLRAFRGDGSAVEFVCRDAADFDPIEGTVFFMYAPFGAKTFAEVVENIKRSLSSRPRKIRIICHSVGRRLMLSQGWLELETELNDGEIAVWRNR